MKRQYVQIELGRIKAPPGEEDVVSRATFPITPYNEAEAARAIAAGEARLVEVDDEGPVPMT